MYWSFSSSQVTQKEKFHTECPCLQYHLVHPSHVLASLYVLSFHLRWAMLHATVSPHYYVDSVFCLPVISLKSWIGILAGIPWAFAAHARFKSHRQEQFVADFSLFRTLVCQFMILIVSPPCTPSPPICGLAPGHLPAENGELWHTQCIPCKELERDHTV